MLSRLGGTAEDDVGDPPQVQISKGVDGGDMIPRASGGYGQWTCSDPGDQDVGTTLQLRH